MFNGGLATVVAGAVAERDAQAGLDVAKLVPCLERDLAGMPGKLENRDADFNLDGREAWVFISIKNRRFRRGYIDWFIDMCDAFGVAGRVCPVDDPYRYNRMAELQRDDLPEGEAEKIERLSSDISRMVQKAINGKRSRRVELVAWREMADQTPHGYHDELRTAFREHESVRAVLHDHITSVKQMETEKCFERYAEFFICEVPILFNAYYANGPTLDIYPGPQVPFFWQIETGTFERELPGLTALTRTDRSMLYLETYDQPEAGK